VKEGNVNPGRVGLEGSVKMIKGSVAWHPVGGRKFKEKSKTTVSKRGGEETT